MKPKIDWLSKESHVLLNPALPREPHEEILNSLLPGHLWFTTSGTTRLGKRWVGLSKEAVLASARAVNHHLQAQKNDRWLLALPSFHIGGMGIWARAFLSGSEVIEFNGEWSAKKFVDMAALTGATLSSLVPTQVFDLVQAEIQAPKSLRAIVVGGGALNPQLYQQARALGWPLLPSFGMTECASQIATAALSSLQEYEFAQPKMLILNHAQCRVSESGILQLRSEALLSVYAEWKNQSWVLQDPKQDGWFQSEDRVELSGPFLKPCGRVTDQIKILGELVDLAKLHDKLSSLLTEDAGIEATLIAREDSRSGMALDLVVACRFGTTIHGRRDDINLALELKRSFDKAVLPFERSQNIYWLRQIPKTELGKVSRAQLLSHLGLV
ncbi:MAG: AMP-binding protein [Bdellovibrionales bacterium]